MVKSQKIDVNRSKLMEEGERITDKKITHEWFAIINKERNCREQIESIRMMKKSQGSHIEMN